MLPLFWRPFRGAVLIAAFAGTLVQAQDSLRRYGTGTAGSGNITPTLWANTTPRPGDSTFKLRAERTLGGTWALLYLAWRRADISVNGVRFLLDLSVTAYRGAYFMSGQGDGGGSGDIPLPLPNNRELLGQDVYAQAFTLDDFAPNPLAIAATSGLRLTPALPAQLMVARAVSGAPDPQTAVDLAANAVVDYDRTQFDDSSGVLLAQRGALALQIDPLTARLRLFDTATFPPSWRSNTALRTEGHAEQIVLTPDATRAYVLYRGQQGSSPPIVAHDARIGSSVGQPWPGPAIRLEQVADPRGMVFTPDSNTAFVVALGPLSGSAGSLSRVDVRPGSATFHQATGEIVFAGALATDVAIATDGATLYVPLVSAGGLSEIAVIDIATFTVTDMDAAAVGVQNLGGEQSRPRTPLPGLLGRTLADPRGQELFCASVGGIARVHVATDSPLFRRVTMLTANLAAGQLVTALALTDAGDRLYAATSVHVVEFDTRLLTSPRAWPIGGTTGLALR